ncbi:MAG: RnfABCDGE type electron transport complex subunit C [Candidatus Omnitrophota bacterium]|nr:RnfABCDGE type electron transport complex subunit C [Candidatus Omnitrophota bacterium]
MIGGLALESKKESSLVSWAIKRSRTRPAKVRILIREREPYRQEVCVEVGTVVIAGQVVAMPVDADAVPSHASMPGEVTRIDRFPDSKGGTGLAVEISGDETFGWSPEVNSEREGWELLSRSNLFAIFRESGLMSMEAGNPLHAKYEPISQGELRTLIVNGCETDPYVTSAHALLMSHPVEILRGAESMRSLIGAERVVIALDASKSEIAELLRSKIFFLKWKHFKVTLLSERYPQSETLPLIRDVLGIDLIRNAGALMQLRFAESARDGYLELAHQAGIAIEDTATLFSVYEAVRYHKPLYERVVTVAGECIIEPRNIWLPFGISFQDAVKSCRGLMRGPEKILMGGPMKGIAQRDWDACVIAQTEAILALPHEVTKPEEVHACIHCGDCVSACPVEISPVMITQAAEADLFEMASDWGISACIGCGNCSYVCPAKRPMADLIRYALEGVGQLSEEEILRPSVLVGVGAQE